MDGSRWSPPTPPHPLTAWKPTYEKGPRNPKWTPTELGAAEKPCLLFTNCFIVSLLYRTLNTNNAFFFLLCVCVRHRKSMQLYDN